MNLPKWVEEIEKKCDRHEEQRFASSGDYSRLLAYILELRSALQQAVWRINELCDPDMSRMDPEEGEIEAEVDAFIALLERPEPPEVER